MPQFDDATLQARRSRAGAALADRDAVVLVGAGEPIGIPGGWDQTFPFVPHPLYYWLSGSRRPGGVMAWDPDAARWTSFVVPASDAERLWEGEPEVPAGEDVAGLNGWLAERPGARVVALGSSLPPMGREAGFDELYQELLDAARRPKDAAEVALMGRAIAATAAGHAAAAALVRPGVSERAIQIELEAAMFRAGADGTGYGSIVGAGTNSAVLHFAPGERRVAEGELVLIDAGAAVAGYTADVTRVYPAGDALGPRQQAIYDVVLQSQLDAIARCRPGVEWHEVHRTAAVTIAAGLVDLGLLRGDPASLAESGAAALFLPHGIGHMVGLGVRDVGGRVLSREPGRICCGARVRVDLPLAEGFLMTVEPGIYFVSALLDDPGRREELADAVAWDRLDDWRSVGGIRIEDDVLVTAGAPEILTAAIPK